MLQKHHNNTLIATLLTILMLATTACSTTDQTTVTAPGDTTATPGDTTATPGDTTATPGDTTAPSSPPTPTDPIPEATEPDPFIYQHPDLVLTNLNDCSTPLGRLCWAVWEFLRMGYVEVIGAIATANPELFEVADSNRNEITEGEDDPVAPVGVANEESEESISETDTYGFLDALDSISEPQIIGVVDDQSLSEELQVFAKAFFEWVEAIEEQAKAVGFIGIDYSQLPYKDFESLPNVDVFDEAQCWPSIEDLEEYKEYWE